MQENFNEARAAVGDLLAVADEGLHDRPGMQILRVQLMKSAIDRYRRFLERPSADPAPCAELARLYVKYGFFASGNGADRETVTVPAYKAAIRIQSQLLREHPNSRALRSDLGWTYIIYPWHDWKSQEAVNAAVKAREIFENLVKEDPTDPLARIDLAWGLAQQGQVMGKDEPFSVQAEELREQLLMEFPHSSEIRRNLRRVYTTMRCGAPRMLPKHCRSCRA